MPVYLCDAVAGRRKSKRGIERERDQNGGCALVCVCDLYKCKRSRRGGTIGNWKEMKKRGAHNELFKNVVQRQPFYQNQLWSRLEMAK